MYNKYTFELKNKTKSLTSSEDLVNFNVQNISDMNIHKISDLKCVQEKIKKLNNNIALLYENIITFIAKEDE
jgi:hypothetical protein